MYIVQCCYKTSPWKELNKLWCRHQLCSKGTVRKKSIKTQQQDNTEYMQVWKKKKSILNMYSVHFRNRIKLCGSVSKNIRRRKKKQNQLNHSQICKWWYVPLLLLLQVKPKHCWHWSLMVTVGFESHKNVVIPSVSSLYSWSEMLWKFQVPSLLSRH